MQAKYAPKIQNAISKAISFVDQILANQKDKPEIMKQALWHAPEEAEYAAAILSLTHGFADLDPELKEVGLKKMTMNEQASLARTLLQSSLELLSSDPKLSYEKLRYAVQVLRRIQMTAGKRVTGTRATGPTRS